MMKIGNIEIEKTAGLAPMASVGDRAYRVMCKKYGASYMVSEMVSSKGICYKDKKTNELLTVTDAEYPLGIQLFGDEPKFMAQATELTLAYKPQIIDVNMGCPVPKVAGSGSGCALMKTPKLASEIIKEMVKLSTVPITVKIRKGWDDDNVNAVEFAKLMEDSGASAITIHGRTKKQMYQPPVDIEIIKQVKQNVSIPVIGNGGIYTPEQAKAMYDYTGCDLVMVAQGSYGKPWIFKDIADYINTGNINSQPTLKEKLDIMLEHIALLVEFKGENIGMREARKHAGWYIKGTNGAGEFRNRCSSLATYDDLEKLCVEILNRSDC